MGRDGGPEEHPNAARAVVGAQAPHRPRSGANDGSFIAVAVTAPSPALEAVIEDARKRARGRRRIAAFAAIAACLAGGVGLAVWKLTASTESGTGSPLVRHALVELTLRYPPRLVDLRTGVATPAPLVREVWWDRARGLARVQTRIAGRVQSDVTGQMCGITDGPRGKRRYCAPPTPFDLTEPTRPGEPLLAGRPRATREGRRGTFRGHRVIWTQEIPENEVALDPRTRRPLGSRWTFADGTLIGEAAYTHFEPLRGRAALSAVRGNPQPTRTSFSSLPPLPHPRTDEHIAAAAAARAELGQPALWLGRSYDGNRLRSIKVGTATFARSHAQTIKFVRLDYGGFGIKEYGRAHPPSALQAPPRGRALLEGRWQATFERGGVLIVVTHRFRQYHLSSARVLRIERALRLMPT